MKHTYLVSREVLVIVYISSTHMSNHLASLQFLEDTSHPMWSDAGERDSGIYWNVLALIGRSLNIREYLLMIFTSTIEDLMYLKCWFINVSDRLVLYEMG